MLCNVLGSVSLLRAASLVLHQCQLCLAAGVGEDILVGSAVDMQGALLG